MTEMSFNTGSRSLSELSVDKKSVNLSQMCNLDKETIVAALIHIITEIITENLDNSQVKLREAQKNLSFYAKKAPSIDILQYFQRILKYTKMEESTLLCVLIYIDQLCESNDFLLTDNNIHR